MQASSAVQKQALINRNVTDMLEHIFRKHGAIHIGIPLLMPKCSLYDANDAYVCLMDRSGGLVSLPYDSRVSCHSIAAVCLMASVLCFITSVL